MVVTMSKYLLYLTKILRHPKTLTYLSLNLNKAISLCANVSTTFGWVVNNIDPDQIPHSVASDLGLHCLLKSGVQILRVHMVFSISYSAIIIFITLFMGNFSKF